MSCLVDVHNLDISSFSDVELEKGCCLATVVIGTKDPAFPSGVIRVQLNEAEARRVVIILRNLWEEDELRSLFCAFSLIEILY